MNTTHTTIRLENSCKAGSRVLEIRALVDPLAFHLFVPARITQTLELKGTCFRYVEQPYGGLQKCRYVGPVTLQCGSHQAFAGAVEYGDEIVLGSLALGYLGLALDLITLQLVPVPTRAGAVYTK